jgi:hypothetical protein
MIDLFARPPAEKQASTDRGQAVIKLRNQDVNSKYTNQKSNRCLIGTKVFARNDFSIDYFGFPPARE